MSETEPGEGGTKATKRGPGRKARPPVTIDLSAEATPAADPAAGVQPPAAESPAVPVDPPVAAATTGPQEIAPARAAPAMPRPEPSNPPPPQPVVRPISPFPPRAERPKTDWSSAGRLIAAGVFG